MAILDRAERAAHGDGQAGTIDPHLLDIMYARRATCEVCVTSIARGRVEASTSRWIDAGAVGLWELAVDAGTADVTLRSLDADAALSALGVAELA